MKFEEALDRYVSDLKAYAVAQKPDEACGFITNHGFVPCENHADNPHLNFVISGEDYTQVQAEYGDRGILGVFHSHTNGRAKPSEADLTSCEQLGLPWALFTLPQEELTTFKPSGFVAPLEGREWAYGIQDCYSVIRDSYQQLGIYLNDYVREPLFSWNTDPDWDMYRRNFAREGFERVQKPQKYDLFSMKVRSIKENHCGIYLGQGKFLHHRIDARSEVIPWDGYWKSCTVGFWRHNEIGDKWITQELSLK